MRNSMGRATGKARKKMAALIVSPENIVNRALRDLAMMADEVGGFGNLDDDDVFNAVHWTIGELLANDDDLWATAKYIIGEFPQEWKWTVEEAVEKEAMAIIWGEYGNNFERLLTDDYHHDYIARKRSNTRRAQAMNHLWDQYDNGYWRCPDPWGKAEYEISLDDGKYNLYVGWPDDEMENWEREPELEGTFPTLEDAMLYTEDNWLGQGREYTASRAPRRRASRRSITAQAYGVMMDELDAAVRSFIGDELGFSPQDVPEMYRLEFEPFEDGEVRIELRAELSFMEFTEISPALDSIVNAYDPNAYWDAVQPGIFVCFVESGRVASRRHIVAVIDSRGDTLEIGDVVWNSRDNEIQTITDIIPDTGFISLVNDRNGLVVINIEDAAKYLTWDSAADMAASRRSARIRRRSLAR